jgi:hypothetical protein
MTKLKSNSYILWQGSSVIDGKPIMLIASGFTRPSTNQKTGYSTISTWIMRSDVSPTEAVKSGDDYSICGNCKHRPKNLGTCYVAVFQAPHNIYKSCISGNTKPPTVDEFKQIVSLINSGSYLLRYGSYGDALAVPLPVWQQFSPKKYTGYTHQWNNPNIPFDSLNQFKKFLMASVDNIKEASYAQLLGWSTFRVASTDDNYSHNDLICANAIDENIKCESCTLCDARHTNIYIPIHGIKSKVNKFNKVYSKS